jgi:PPM family protein phosphatase
MPRLSHSAHIEEEIFWELEKCIKQLNEKILNYGETRKVKLGTTLTALLIVHQKYYIAQIGDSRAYRISDSLNQLTKDQTLVAREVACGNITEEQAKYDPRRNVLLQCVGATKEIEVDFSKGDVLPNTVFMLCSDGFYHQITEEELALDLKPETIKNNQQLKGKVVQLVELVKARKEVDNISVVAAKVL